MGYSEHSDTEESTEGSGEGKTYSGSSEESASAELAHEEDLPAEPLAFVVMTLVIGGYTLIGVLQHHLKTQLGIADTGTRSEVFTQSVAMVQWGKTFMTMGQNVLLSFMAPVSRVYLAMGVMLFGTLIPPVVVYGLGNTWIGWVPFSYLSIGLSLGVFEATYLSVLAPFGPRTKSLAIMGFPAAFAIVNIIGQSLMALFDMNVLWIFWYIAIGQIVAIFLFKKFAPSSRAGKSRGHKQASFLSSLADWKEWIPGILPFCCVNIVSHFVMESVLPAVFNTYNGCKVSLWGPENKSLLMNPTWFFVVMSITMAIGDMSSRKIGYLFKFDTFSQNMAGIGFALCLSSTGLYLTIKGIASLTWLAVFLAFFGSGFNYAVTAKYIDKFVPRKHNLAGYSLWMFVGYCGAISGAVLVTMVRGWICGSHEASLYVYQCLTQHPVCHGVPMFAEYVPINATTGQELMFT